MSTVIVLPADTGSVTLDPCVIAVPLIFIEAILLDIAVGLNVTLLSFLLSSGETHHRWAVSPQHSICHCSPQTAIRLMPAFGVGQSHGASSGKPSARR